MGFMHAFHLHNLPRAPLSKESRERISKEYVPSSKVITDNGAPLGRRKSPEVSMTPKSCQMYDNIEVPSLEEVPKVSFYLLVQATSYLS